MLSAYEIKLTLSSPASLIPLSPSPTFPPPSLLWLSILSPNISLLFASFCSAHQTHTTQRLWCCTAFSDDMFPSCCPPSPASSPSFQAVHTMHLLQNPIYFLNLEESLSPLALLLTGSLLYGTTHVPPWIRNVGFDFISLPHRERPLE